MLYAPPTQISERLRRFTAGLPGERNSLLQFALRVAAELEPGSRLLDVGAGDGPYRELFDHLRYESTDWEHSVHPGARQVDYVGPAHDLPIPDAEYDAVLCTQVLEHVPNPDAVIAELYRVLRPGGRLYLTVPLAWELHEMPFDFYRYTPHGLATILGGAGFVKLDIRPRNDCFTTLAQLLQNIGSTMGRYPDGKDGRRAEVQSMLQAMAVTVASFSDLDARGIFPLGYSVVAIRPTDGPATERRKTPELAELTSAHGFTTLCFAADVLAEPKLLGAYAEHFSGSDDATLLIYAPATTPELAAVALSRLVAELGLDGPGSPDMVALPYPEAPDESALAAGIDAVLSLRPPWGAFAGLRWAHPGTLADLHELACRAATARDGGSNV
jgi:SAM-dependent methyltransferase